MHDVRLPRTHEANQISERGNLAEYVHVAGHSGNGVEGNVRFCEPFLEFSLATCGNQHLVPALLSGIGHIEYVSLGATPIRLGDDI